MEVTPPQRDGISSNTTDFYDVVSFKKKQNIVEIIKWARLTS